MVHRSLVRCVLFVLFTMISGLVRSLFRLKITPNGREVKLKTGINSRDSRDCEWRVVKSSQWKAIQCSFQWFSAKSKNKLAMCDWRREHLTISQSVSCSCCLDMKLSLRCDSFSFFFFHLQSSMKCFFTFAQNVLKLSHLKGVGKYFANCKLQTAHCKLQLQAIYRHCTVAAQMPSKRTAGSESKTEKSIETRNSGPILLF